MSQPKFIYEVRVTVDAQIADPYRIWLHSHIAQIVSQAGFHDAVLYRRDGDAPDGTVGYTVHYRARDRATIDRYLTVLAPRFRGDAKARFGGQFHAERLVLTVEDTQSDTSVEPAKGRTMNTQVNWNKIRNEFQRLTDVDKLKDEVQRIGAEIRKFDFHTVLSPTAQAKVSAFEKRYAELMRTIHQAQRQVDREVNRIMRQIKGHRNDMTKKMAAQKSKLEKVSVELRKKFAAGGAKKTTAKKPRKTTAKRAPARKSRKG